MFTTSVLTVLTVLTVVGYWREFAKMVVVAFVVAGVGTNVSTLRPVGQVVGRHTAV